VLNVNFNRLYYFHVVATAGSQAAAARQLGIGQSTLSEQVKQLETTLGTLLFERSGGRMRLTDAGRKCLEFTETMFSAAERLLQMFALHSAERIVVEVAVSSSVARSFATESFLPLLDDNDLVPRIRHGHYNQLIEELRARELDIVLSDVKPSGRTAEGVVSTIAARLDFVFVASPALARTVQHVPSGLAEQPFLDYPESSMYRMAIHDYFRRHSLVPQVVMETDDLDLIRLAACKGRGIAALPERLVRGDIQRGTLVLLGRLDLDMNLYLNHLEGEPTNVVRRAIEILTQGLQHE
jgi:LysR family transcriptional regulator, transcriptional activator of nhaA